MVDSIRPEFFYFLFYRFFLQQVSVGGRKKNHSDHFPIELKSKETRLCFLRFQFYWKMVRINFILPIKMAISHQVLSLGVFNQPGSNRKDKTKKHLPIRGLML